MCDVCSEVIRVNDICYACWACSCTPTAGRSMWICCVMCAQQNAASGSSGLGGSVAAVLPVVDPHADIYHEIQRGSVAGWTLKRYRDRGMVVEVMGCEALYIVERSQDEVSHYPSPAVPLFDYPRHCTRPIALLPLPCDIQRGGYDIGAVLPDAGCRWRFVDWLENGQIPGLPERFQTAESMSHLLVWCDGALRGFGCTHFRVRERPLFSAVAPNRFWVAAK